MSVIPKTTFVEVFKQYREARMNCLYYAERLASFQKWDAIIEWVIVITGPSSAATLWFWKSGIGTWLWAVLGAVAILLASIKPFLNLRGKIERSVKLWSAYTMIFHDLKGVIEKINLGSIEDTEARISLGISSKHLAGLGLQDEPKPFGKLLEKCQDQMEREIPAKESYSEQTVQ